MYIYNRKFFRPENDVAGETEGAPAQPADSTTQLMADAQNLMEGLEGSRATLTAKPSGAKSITSSLRSPEPVDNPSADLRNMRRIIAEDKEWSLMTVPLLWELCITHIVVNFESKLLFLPFKPYTGCELWTWCVDVGGVGVCVCVCGWGGGCFVPFLVHYITNITNPLSY